jgi:hypothetical protein
MKASLVSVKINLSEKDDRMGRAREFVASEFYFPHNVRVKDLEFSDENAVVILENRTEKFSDEDLAKLLEDKLENAVRAIPQAARPARRRAF